MADLGTITIGAFDAVNSDTQTTITGTDPVLEAIASADDSDYLGDVANTSHTSVAYFAIDALPGDFASMDTLSVQLRYHRDVNSADRQWTALSVHILQSDLTTPLVDERTIATNITTTTPTNSGALAFTINATGLAANAATWNAAVLEINFAVNKVKGGASDSLRVTAAELTGTYTTGVTPVTGSGSPTMTRHTGAGSGSTGPEGSGNPTLTAHTGAGEGSTGTSGTGDAQLAAHTGAGSGATQEPVTGTGDLQLIRVTGAGTGTGAAIDPVFSVGALRDSAGALITTGADFNPETDITWHSLFWAEGTDFVAQGYSDTDSVTTWPNETTEVDATTLGASPLYVAARTNLNSRPAVDTAGGAVQTSTFTSNPTYPITAVIVADIDDVTTLRALADGDASGRMKISVVGGEWQLRAAFTITGGTATTGAWLVVAHLDGGSAAGGDWLDANGTRQITTNAGTDTIDTLTIGADYVGNDIDAAISLLGIYEGDITADGSWADFKTWVTDHYGITIA